jgi:Fur family peroxide stress response transcriptional regulator
VEKFYGKVKKDFPPISLATVDKTLIVMKEMGEVLALGFGEGGNRYDGNKPYPLGGSIFVIDMSKWCQF